MGWIWALCFSKRNSRQVALLNPLMWLLHHIKTASDSASAPRPGCSIEAALGKVAWSSRSSVHLRQFPDGNESSSTLECLEKSALHLILQEGVTHCSNILTFYSITQWPYMCTYFFCLVAPEALKTRPLTEQVTTLRNKRLVAVPFPTQPGCHSTSQLCWANSLRERRLVNNGCKSFWITGLLK